MALKSGVSQDNCSQELSYDTSQLFCFRTQAIQNKIIEKHQPAWGDMSEVLEPRASLLETKNLSIFNIVDGMIV